MLSPEDGENAPENKEELEEDWVEVGKDEAEISEVFQDLKMLDAPPIPARKLGNAKFIITYPAEPVPQRSPAKTSMAHALSQARVAYTRTSKIIHAPSPSHRSVMHFPMSLSIPQAALITVNPSMTQESCRVLLSGPFNKQTQWSNYLGEIFSETDLPKIICRGVEYEITCVKDEDHNKKNLQWADIILYLGDYAAQIQKPLTEAIKYLETENQTVRIFHIMGEEGVKKTALLTQLHSLQQLTFLQANMYKNHFMSLSREQAQLLGEDLFAQLEAERAALLNSISPEKNEPEDKREQKLTL